MARLKGEYQELMAEPHFRSETGGGSFLRAGPEHGSRGLGLGGLLWTPHFGETGAVQVSCKAMLGCMQSHEAVVIGYSAQHCRHCNDQVSRKSWLRPLHQARSSSSCKPGSSSCRTLHVYAAVGYTVNSWGEC